MSKTDAISLPFQSESYSMVSSQCTKYHVFYCLRLKNTSLFKGQPLINLYTYIYILYSPEDVSSSHFTAWNIKMVDKYLSDEE